MPEAAAIITHALLTSGTITVSITNNVSAYDNNYAYDDDDDDDDGHRTLYACQVCRGYRKIN